MCRHEQLLLCAQSFFSFFLVWQQSNQLNALSKNNLFSFCLAKNTKDKATHKNQDKKENFLSVSVSASGSFSLTIYLCHSFSPSLHSPSPISPFPPPPIVDSYKPRIQTSIAKVKNCPPFLMSTGHDIHCPNIQI